MNDETRREMLTTETSASRRAPLLRVRSLSKTFGSQRVLGDVSFDVREGEIYGLVGHNGSGKSTLIKILAGYHDPDPGAEIAVSGPRPEAASPRRRMDRIRFIHQDLGLVPTLSAAENLALGGSGYQTGRFGRIAWSRQRRAALATFREFDVDIDPDTPVALLSPGEQAVVAVARALARWDEPHGILVLDEATAALHPAEADKLASSARSIARAGGAVVFVSHRIGEVLALADRVGVLRDGELVAEEDASNLDADALVALIAGRSIEEMYPTPPRPARDVVLAVRELSTNRIVSLSFDVHAREIVGVAGLDGSGREQLAGALVGEPPPSGGRVSVEGREIGDLTPRRAMAAGIAMITGDRSLSLVSSLTVRENLTLPLLRPLWSRGRVSRRKERQDVETWMRRMSIRARGPEQPVGELSGGNQQKVALAKWLRTRPRVLVLDEPTRGVDVGAKASIYRDIAAIAAQGAATLICSADVKELAELCDRVLVLRDGAIGAEIEGDSLSESAIVTETLR